LRLWDIISPVFFLKKPTPSILKEVLAGQISCGYSYEQVEATKASTPTGYNVDHNRILLGNGADAFRVAKSAIDCWKMFDMPWIELFPACPAIKVGEIVAVVVKHLTFWSVNVSRIVYTIQEEARYGFAYGTLPCHSERGEERFVVEYHKATDEVWYDLYALSRPHHPLAQIGYPISRYLQKRFARESLIAMKRAMAK
jgi:uncharacterized protein (UPF0548 family)